MFNVKNYLNWQVACALLGAASLFTSCDNNLIYDDLAPCETRHAVRFQWDTNMVGADAFRGNVHSVAIYGFDQNDKLAFQFAEKGDALAMQGYTLPITGVEPGEYTIVAWCGLDNDGTRAESFIVADTEIGVTTRQELICRMERDIHPDGTHHSAEQLYDLYHGTSYGVKIYAKNDMDHQGDHIYQVNLTKDTNNIRIMLQQIGKDVNVGDFTFKIEEANGTLGCDNELKDDETINYEPFNTKNVVAGMDETRAGAIVNERVAVADLKMSRLMDRRQSMLTIRNNDGTKVLQVPLRDYALLAKPFEAESFTNQEYLDRQDNYRLMFFLDSDGAWIEHQILINSWAPYEQNGDLQ